MSKTINGSDYDPARSELKLRLEGDRVLFSRVKKSEKADELTISDSDEKEYYEGRVVSVGPGKKDFPVTVKLGEICRYEKNGVLEFLYPNKDGEDEYFDMVRNVDVMVVI